MSFKMPEAPAPVLPQQPAAPPMFGQQTQGAKKPGAKSSQPTFLGAGLTAASQAQASGQKTLLGQ
jgi:hypothetical protein